jgi:hypothetical protein
MSDYLERLGANSPDSFWILLKGNRKNYRQLVVDSEKIKLVDQDDKTLWESSQACALDQIKLKHE